MKIKSIGEILKDRDKNQTPDLRGLPIRPRNKQNRFYIDNEFLERGYVARFKKFPLIPVYAVLCKYANARTQKCWPACETIIKETGIKNRNTVWAVITLLEKLSIIYTERSSGRTSNRYWMLDSKYWKEPNSITVDTVRDWVNKNRIKKKPTVSNEETNSIPGDTRSH
ncbi:MAG: helix-turn-helix domain-containing protein [Candidatus Pacebacteria bacterium]|nr:helix-turn-helix domain-containing protein [Candidatus Paceibacterota bacterium]